MYTPLGVFITAWARDKTHQGPLRTITTVSCTLTRILCIF